MIDFFKKLFNTEKKVDEAAITQPASKSESETVPLSPTQLGGLSDIQKIDYELTQLVAASGQ